MGYEKYERYQGGSEQAELLIFEKFARDVMRVQEKNRRATGAAGVHRAFHAKTVLGVTNARLLVRPDLPEELRQGCFQPGADLSVTVRFSNASGMLQPDTAKDMRGIALRVHPHGGQAGEGSTHDLLMTNFPVSPAADAREFVAMAEALAGRTSTLSRLLSLVLRLPPAVGVVATIRIIWNLQKSARPVDSLAQVSYWSRGAMLWGDAGPVRYCLRPAASPPVPPSTGADRLRTDLVRRLAAGDLEFDFCVQRYVSERRTPVEKTSKRWCTPFVPVAQLVVPRQDPDTAEARWTEHRVDQLAFNPWNTTDTFRPLGNLNRARRAAYEASTAHRLQHGFVTEEPRHVVVLNRLATHAFALINRVRPWHELPDVLGLLNLSVLRRRLRQENLIDAGLPPGVQVTVPEPAVPQGVRVSRTDDGTYTDLSSPRMGAAGAPFGRNMRVDARQSDLPDPIRVSSELLARERFIPARSLNVLAAAWIQFQVHDWVQHHRHDVREHSIDLPLPDGQEWQSRRNGPVERVMRIAADDGEGNVVSHWWDGSEIYGSDEKTAQSLREADGTGARLKLEDGHLPVGPGQVALAGLTDSWWLGLSVLQTLFAREHNALCDALQREYPHLDDERTYRTARLIVSALIAKIHTVEWTPAILATDTLDTAMNLNWRGAPGAGLTRLGVRLLDPHALHGIPHTRPDHHGVPFSLTEEFVTVYRMHPLVPDDYVFVDRATGAVEVVGFGDISGEKTEPMLRRIGLADALYSLAIANPGAVTLHNFPHALRRFERNGEIIDLAVVDIVRTRTRGVPRYNEFRAALHKPRIRRFEQLTREPETLRRLKSLYGSVDEIDTVIGLLAEEPPAGFGFSDTAFRVFLLMASRRLQSDRFLTVDFRPEVYTPLGMDWIERGGFADVVQRHCPELVGLPGTGKAAFAPWR